MLSFKMNAGFSILLTYENLFHAGHQLSNENQLNIKQTYEH